jgi:hypothetical protein
MGQLTTPADLDFHVSDRLNSSTNAEHHRQVINDGHDRGCTDRDCGLGMGLLCPNGMRRRNSSFPTNDVTSRL